jgi:DNA-binding response OmpR family regulator
MSKVLVIDDFEFIRDFCVDVFTEAGYVVIQADTGELGIENFIKHRPDCVILDLLLPGIDGIEVLRQIREINSEVPVVLMTGDDPAWAGRTFESLGANAFINKAGGADKLLEIVEDLIIESES